MEKVNFIDAQQMKKEHPDTFEAPNQKELNKIKVDSLVKICVEGERFWTVVTKVENDTITAIVNNELVMTHKHGLMCYDVLTFEKKNVYSIYENEK